MDEKKYYGFQDILKFLSFEYEFDKPNRYYPFNRGRENVMFSWGQVLIPKDGIMEMVQNKISGIKEYPLTAIKMMYQVPFIVALSTKIFLLDLDMTRHINMVISTSRFMKYAFGYWSMQLELMIFT